MYLRLLVYFTVKFVVSTIELPHEITPPLNTLLFSIAVRVVSKSTLVGLEATEITLTLFKIAVRPGFGFVVRFTGDVAVNCSAIEPFTTQSRPRGKSIAMQLNCTLTPGQRIGGGRAASNCTLDVSVSDLSLWAT